MCFQLYKKKKQYTKLILGLCVLLYKYKSHDWWSRSTSSTGHDCWSTIPLYLMNILASIFFTQFNGLYRWWDNKELIQLIATPDEWHAFTSELEYFSFWKFFFFLLLLCLLFHVTTMHVLTALLKKARVQEFIFVHVSFSTPDCFFFPKKTVRS